MFFNEISSKKFKAFTCLNESEINILQLKAKNCQQSFSESIKTSGENMAGDNQSQIRGAGTDFEENKPYEAGSDSRHINWRTYARTQQLYVNIYNEDKRPSTYLVLDQRPNMYFGTRKQLKIKLALKIATYSLLLASNQQKTTSGVQIGSSLTWHNSYNSANATLSFIKAINNPISDIDKLVTPSLNDVLSKLNLKDGAELIIVSDFHDMNDTTVSIIYNLSRHYKITLVQVQDPIEIALPSKGQFNIQETSETIAIKLNCSKNMNAAYEKRVADRFEKFKTQYLTMGVNFNQYTTLDTSF